MQQLPEGHKEFLKQILANLCWSGWFLPANSEICLKLGLALLILNYVSNNLRLRPKGNPFRTFWMRLKQREAVQDSPDEAEHSLL